MIGGGPGSFIGGLHRTAMRMDNCWQLVGGAFSREPDGARPMAEELGLDPDRVGADWRTILTREATRQQDRAAAVIIVTPNDTHAQIAIAAVELGFHVFCEKPLARSFEEACLIRDAVCDSATQFGLAHVYCGHAMVQEARARVKSGALGVIRRVSVEYTQGWLSQPSETDPANIQAVWRTDPAKAGDGGAVGDIGTHAFQLLEHILGTRVTHLSALLNTGVAGRRVNDSSVALLKLDGGGIGTLTACQVSVGDANRLVIRIYGERGSLSWSQEQADQLCLRQNDKPAQMLIAGSDQTYLSPVTRGLCRTPCGHVEGYLEALANLYLGFGDLVSGRGDAQSHWLPGLNAGMRGMAFVQAMLESHRAGGVWTKMEGPL